MKSVFPAFFFAASLASAADLAPLLTVPNEVVLDHQFAGPELNKEDWAPRQGTRWAVEDGLLVGIPSTTEYQEKRKDHKGYEPRVSVPKTPAEFAMKFSVRFVEGEETAVVPFFEMGHHVCRIHFTRTDGLIVLADAESQIVTAAPDFKYEAGKWYHVFAEMKGDEIVVQFADGPTLYAKHECFAKPNPSGGNGLGFAGPKAGRVEIDNVTIWNIKADTAEGWATRKAKFPAFETVVIEKKAKPAKGKAK